MKREFEIDIGMVLSEESSGTNAVALSMKLKYAIYTHCDQHYCKFLQRYIFYCVPLQVFEEIIGYLAVTTTERIMIKELIAITNLMSYRLINEFKQRRKQNVVPGASNIKLNHRQLNILKLISEGMTDKAISVETGLSFATIQYHKKNIYRKLGVNSSTEAVIKALKLNLISLDQITC